MGTPFPAFVAVRGAEVLASGQVDIAQGAGRFWGGYFVPRGAANAFNPARLQLRARERAAIAGV